MLGLLQLPYGLVKLLNMRYKTIRMDHSKNAFADILYVLLIYVFGGMNQVSIRRFLDKKNDKSKENNEDISTIKRQDILRKIVKDSVKKHKLHTVRKIVKKNDETKPWGSANHAKVCMYFVFH